MLEAKEVLININELKPNSYNPNEMTEEMLENLATEIRETGYLQPILINKNKVIIDGEHRWKAGIKAGLTQLKCWEVDVDENSWLAKKITINLNQLKGSNSTLKLADLLEQLSKTISLEQISKELFMSEPEINSLLEINKLPDLNSFQLPPPAEQEKIKCPNCGFEFDG